MDAVTDPFRADNYKSTLKTRMKLVQLRRPSLTWRKLAAEIPVQYTYLSKALNDDATHLSEDHIFSVCRALEFFPDETEFIMLLRSHATARDSERKEHLYRKIRDIRQKRELTSVEQPLTSNKFDEQMRYLFEPLCQVVHMALDLKHFREDPRRLCGPLNLSITKLQDILRILSRNDYIALEDDGLNIREVKPQKLFFGPEHFLMRYHLNIVKSQMLARIAQTKDDQKYGFAATFTMDDQSFTKLKEEFQIFLKKAEKIAAETKAEGVYQLSFDIFRWL